MNANEYLDISGEWRPCNPKTAGSGIVTCRPQVGPCPGDCPDCFFQGGRYYEDIDVPHIPDPEWVNDRGLVVRMNDGNDSNHQRDLVIEVASKYRDVFFNTRIPRLDFPGPVVLTVNGDHTDDAAWMVTGEGVRNLMTVRVRANTWNTALAHAVIDYYRPLDVPVRLTFMAYYNETVRQGHYKDYEWRKRTLNNYWCLKPEARERLETELGVDGCAVHTCTSKTGHHCIDCGKCLEMYLRWMQRTGGHNE